VRRRDGWFGSALSCATIPEKVAPGAVIVPRDGKKNCSRCSNLEVRLLDLVWAVSRGHEIQEADEDRLAVSLPGWKGRVVSKKRRQVPKKGSLPFAGAMSARLGFFTTVPNLHLGLVMGIGTGYSRCQLVANIEPSMSR